jgi:hypothetical protein
VIQKNQLHLQLSQELFSLGGVSIHSHCGGENKDVTQNSACINRIAGRAAGY